MDAMDKNTLANYFSGKATPEEEARIMEWAQSSPENYRQYLNERKLWDALLMNSLPDKTKADAAKGKSIRVWKAIGIAASCSLLLALSWIYSDKGWSAGMQTVTVPPGQRVHIMLEDSTSVWLNSRTTLTYPTSYGGDAREVILNGEAYFDVRQDKEKPFIVRTDRYNVTVTGTSFNIYAYHDDAGHFETSLLSGSVNINSLSAPDKTLRLAPDETATEVNGELKVSKTNNPDHFRWREGLICLDDVLFADLMKKFSIYFDIPVRIENPAVLNYRCTGKFRQSDGIEYALRVLQKDLNFEYERKGTENSQIIFIR